MREPKIVEVRLCQDLEDKQAHSVVRSYSMTMTDEPIHSSALPQGSCKVGPTVPTCKFDLRMYVAACDVGSALVQRSTGMDVCVCGGGGGGGGSRQLPPRGEPGNTCFRWPKADSTAVNRVE